MATTVCAWCGAGMGTTEATETSHGICQSCYDTEVAKLATAAMDAEDLFDLDELERHADMLRREGKL